MHIGKWKQIPTTFGNEETKHIRLSKLCMKKNMTYEYDIIGSNLIDIVAGLYGYMGGQGSSN